MFSDANGVAEITENPVIAATGHSWGEWSIIVEPTDYVPGTAVRTCENNSEHKEYPVIPVLTDTSVWTEDLRIEPSETENGLIVYISQYGSVSVVIPALNPQYDYSIKYKNSAATITVPQGGIYGVIFADYDSDNRLISVYTDDRYLSKGENFLAPAGFNLSGKVKVMLWKSLQTMNPLCAAADE